MPKLKIDELIKEKAMEIAKILSSVSRCNINIDDIDLNELTLDDIKAVLTDTNAYNEYKLSCAPSARDYLAMVAITASLCYYSELSEDFCRKFFEALGEFIVTNDARAFLKLELD